MTITCGNSSFPVCNHRRTVWVFSVPIYRTMQWVETVQAALQLQDSPVNRNERTILARCSASKFVQLSVGHHPITLSCRMLRKDQTVNKNDTNDQVAERVSFTHSLLLSTLIAPGNDEQEEKSLTVNKENHLWIPSNRRHRNHWPARVCLSWRLVNKS